LYYYEEAKVKMVDKIKSPRPNGQGIAAKTLKETA
jgi:hypothetical protein